MTSMASLCPASCSESLSCCQWAAGNEERVMSSSQSDSEHSAIKSAQAGRYAYILSLWMENSIYFIFFFNSIL